MELNLKVMSPRDWLVAVADRNLEVGHNITVNKTHMGAHSL